MTMFSGMSALLGTLPMKEVTIHYSSSLLQARVLGCLFLAYLLLVRALRYCRCSSIQAKFELNRTGSPPMTLEAAQSILLELAELEFPFTFEKSLQFALFRTYGIPTISKLLVETRQLAVPANSPKRYVDTVVLVSEFIGRRWGSKEWCESMSRMNCLHSVYQKAGKIRNDEMLYTLALFACEPLRWINRWEWRELSEVERCALGVLEENRRCDEGQLRRTTWLSE